MCAASMRRLVLVPSGSPGDVGGSLIQSTSLYISFISIHVKLCGELDTP